LERDRMLDLIETVVMPFLVDVLIGVVPPT
jgi:hypothetical protein